MPIPKSITRNRPMVALISLMTGALVIGLMSLLPDKATVILLDKGSEFFPFPLTLQNIMWLVLFVGFGECLVRYVSVREEEKHIGENYLHLGKRFLSSSDVGDIHARLKPMAQGTAYLPRLIYRTAQTLLMTKSPDSAIASINSNVDLYGHSIDLRYTMLRYLTWLIPTLGFIGTSIGIAIALKFAGEADWSDPLLLSKLSANLGVGFYCTFLALLQAAVLVFFMNILQAKEEMCLNVATQYCLDNLIGRYRSEE